MEGSLLLRERKVTRAEISIGAVDVIVEKQKESQAIHLEKACQNLADVYREKLREKTLKKILKIEVCIHMVYRRTNYTAGGMV